MKKYQIDASEVVYYQVVVEAKSAKEAEKMVYDGKVDITIYPIESDGLQIDSVTELL